MGVLKPELIFKSIVPIIMAGILGIYGLIVAVILQGSSKFDYADRLQSTLALQQVNKARQVAMTTHLVTSISHQDSLAVSHHLYALTNSFSI